MVKVACQSKIYQDLVSSSERLLKKIKDASSDGSNLSSIKFIISIFSLRNMYNKYIVLNRCLLYLKHMIFNFFNNKILFKVEKKCD